MALKVGRKPVGFLSQRQFLAAFAKKSVFDFNTA